MRHLLAGLVVVLLAGCGGAPITVAEPPPPSPTVEACKNAAMNYDDALKPILARWDDALKITESTARIALAAQISTLQEIKREAEALTPGDCVLPTHTLITQSMNATIDGYLAFSGKKSEDEVQRYLVGAKLDYDLALAQINDLSRGLEVASVPAKLTVDELVERYKSAGWQLRQRPLNHGGTAWGGERDGVMVEVVNYADGALKSVSVGVGPSGDGTVPTSVLIEVAQIVIPEWTDAETWISARMDAKQDQVVVIGRNKATLTSFFETKSLTIVFY